MENNKVYGLTGVELVSKIPFHGYYEKFFDNKVVGSLSREGRVEALLGVEFDRNSLLTFLAIPHPKFELPISFYMFENVLDTNPKVEYLGNVVDLGYSFSGSQHVIAPVISSVMEAFRFSDTSIQSSLARVNMNNLKSVLKGIIQEEYLTQKQREVVFNYK